MTANDVAAPRLSALPGLRPLVWLQLFLAWVPVLGNGLLYLAGLIRAGDHATLVGTPIDPKDVLPFGFHLWNPFTWLYLGVVLVSALWPVAALAAMLGVANLARPQVRADRRHWLPLLFGVASCVAMLVIIFSPGTLEIRHWLAD